MESNLYLFTCITKEMDKLVSFTELPDFIFISFRKGILFTEGIIIFETGIPQSTLKEIIPSIILTQEYNKIDKKYTSKPYEYYGNTFNIFKGRWTLN